jgi:hypothetical protein
MAVFGLSQDALALLAKCLLLFDCERYVRVTMKVHMLVGLTRRNLVLYQAHCPSIQGKPKLTPFDFRVTRVTGQSHGPNCVHSAPSEKSRSTAGRCGDALSQKLRYVMIACGMYLDSHRTKFCITI